MTLLEIGARMADMERKAEAERLEMERKAKADQLDLERKMAAEMDRDMAEMEIKLAEEQGERKK